MGQDECTPSPRLQSVSAVSRRLGHAIPQVTMAVYAHALQHEDDEAAQAIENAMSA